MNNLTLIALAVILTLLVSLISQELGITNLLIVRIDPPATPDTGNILTGLITVVATAINLIWSFVQIMTYQVNGIPTILNTFIMLPMSFMIGYIYIRVIRGGG